MLKFSRCFLSQGKAAIRALKLGLGLERWDVLSCGADLRAISVADEFRLASMAFPHCVAFQCNVRRNWLMSGYVLGLSELGLSAAL
jgi:hypothetical protein